MVEAVERAEYTPARTWGVAPKKLFMAHNRRIDRVTHMGMETLDTCEVLVIRLRPGVVSGDACATTLFELLMRLCCPRLCPGDISGGSF